MTVNSKSPCCLPQDNFAALPLSLTNPPGLPAIRYRIGTFSSFRRTMLDCIALPDLLASSVTTLASDLQANGTTITVLDYSGFPVASNFQIKIGDEYLQVIEGAGTSTWKVARGTGAAAYAAGEIVTLSPPNPFAGWQEGTATDYAMMLIELWAYLADVLTFYQERIANESYLGTAALRSSLLELVTLIDYKPKPGSSSSGLAAFTAAPGTGLIIPAGFRLGSKPAPGQPSLVFETSAATKVSGDNSAIALSPLSPDVQFPSNTIVLSGVNSGLAADDYVLAVEHQGTSGEAAHLLQIDTLFVDKTGNTTTVIWSREVGNGSYTQASKQVSVYALRVKAAPFGANAPAWNTLSPTLTNSNLPADAAGKPIANYPDAPFKDTNWDLRDLGLEIMIDGARKIDRIPTMRLANQVQKEHLSIRVLANPWFYVPTPGDQKELNELYLDAVYKQLNFSEQSPGWAVLLTGPVFQVCHAIDARTAAKVAYSLSSKVTRLTFAENITANVFPIRDTVVLTGDDLLPLQMNLPVSPFVSGDQLILQGVHSQLQSGQTVVIRGTVVDPNGATETTAGESCVIDGAPVLDAADDITTIKLKTPLTNTYLQSTCTLFGNIVEITQGETVKDEILGGSDGTAFQSYTLKKSPVTYLPSSDPEGLSAVKSTLRVTVNGLAWDEQPNLAASEPNSHDFTTSLGDEGETTVVFGDGVNGARPPSGANNIHARYRKGLGSSGNLPADAIQKLVDSTPNLKKVTNPVPSTGGSDADSAGRIRTAAPASLRTFSRAVSAPDYAALALDFPGIAKAAAQWIVNDPFTNQLVSRPYVQLTVATTDESPIRGTLLAGNLRSYLDNHRDPNVSLRIQDFNPVYIELIADVEIDSHFPQDATLAAANAALNTGQNADGTFGYFAFQNLQFGQPVFLSAVYAALHKVPGVVHANITSLRRVGPGLAEPAGIAPHDIIVGPTEIALIGASGTGQGQVVVSGRGGFIDS